MFKRTWIVLIIALALGIVLSACGSGKLAEDLTPIPTLPQGQEPDLVAALQASPVPASSAGEGQTDLVSTGETLFDSACAGCHSAADGAGPAFTGMAERAATSVEGMSAEDYLHESIVDPSAHIVKGFNDGIMPKTFGTQYSEEQINALVAYIMAKSGGASPEATEEAVATAEATEEAVATVAPTEEVEATEEAVETNEATEEALVGDPAAGETLFASTCAGCHAAQDSVGPGLTGMGEHAATRVDGMSAEDYLHQSIVDPSAHVVEGFNDGIMPHIYADTLSGQQIADLIAYILTQ